MLIALIFAALVAPGHQLSLRPLSVPVMTGGASLAKAGERIVSITEVRSGDERSEESR